MLKISSEFNLSPVKTVSYQNLGSMIMIVELVKFMVFISSFWAFFSECPSVSAFSRKVADKKHASEKLVHLIIFPLVWSLTRTSVYSSSALLFLDHAFVFLLCLGKMIKIVPWSFFRVVYSISTFIASDAWSSHYPWKILSWVYLFWGMRVLILHNP